MKHWPPGAVKHRGKAKKRICGCSRRSVLNVRPARFFNAHSPIKSRWLNLPMEGQKDKQSSEASGQGKRGVLCTFPALRINVEAGRDTLEVARFKSQTSQRSSSFCNGQRRIMKRSLLRRMHPDFVFVLIITALAAVAYLVTLIVARPLWFF